MNEDMNKNLSINQTVIPLKGYSQEKWNEKEKWNGILAIKNRYTSEGNDKKSWHQNIEIA